MNIAHYIAQRLAVEGITHAFVVQGAANNDLIYAIADTPGMRYIACGHEQAAGFAAEGWSKARDDGTTGLAISTSGPGAQNLLAAIANCWYDSVPCVFITGQVNRAFLRKPDSGLRQLGFQETDIVAMVTPITKYARQVLDPEDVPKELERALAACRSGRPGPVLLDVCLDRALKGLAGQHNRLVCRFQGRTEAVAKVQRFRESAPEQPGEAVADLKPSILQPAGHPVISPWGAADDDIGAWLQHAEDFSRPLRRPVLKAP